MDLSDYIEILFNALKNILIGLLSIAVVVGLGYGIYIIMSNISLTTMLVILIFFIAYWIGKALRNS
jgi:hypothetical protein